MKKRPLVIASVVLAVLFVVGGLFTLQLNAGSLFAPPPSPPPSPTGPIPPRLPTFDINQLGKLPTRALAPGETPPSTLSVNPNVTYAVPTFPPLNPVTPDSNWVTYRDPNLGFSFQYPSNWHIDVIKNGPPGPEYTDITIRNYDLVITKGSGFTPDLMKIEVQASPEFVQYGDVDRWFAHYLQSLRDPNNPASNPSFPDLQHLMINNVPAIRWTDIGAQAVGLGKGMWLYSIAAFPDNSKYSAVFDRFLTSFQIP